MRTEGELSEKSCHELVAIDNVYLSPHSPSVAPPYLTPGNKLPSCSCGHREDNTNFLLEDMYYISLNFE